MITWISVDGFDGRELTWLVGGNGDGGDDGVDDGVNGDRGGCLW